MFLIAACSKDRVREKPPQPPAASVLDHVPADTPYLIAGVAPLPSEYGESLDVAVQSYTDSIRELAGSIGWHNTDRIASAALEELESGGFGTLGLDKASEWAIFGLGIMPHIRVRLADTSAITAFVDKIEARAGAKLPRRKFRGVEYFAFDLELGYTFAVGLHGTDLVAALYPHKGQVAALENMFGVVRPRDAVGRDAAVQLAKRHGYHESWLGWIDVPTALRLVLELFGDELPLPAACERELLELAGHFPRYEFGYSELTAKRRIGGAVWQLSPELGAALAEIFGPTPGYSPPGDATPLFSVGFGLDGAALANHLAALGAKRFDCEDIAAVASVLPAARELGPVLGELGGFYAVVQDLRTGTMDLLPGVTGFAVIRHGDPNALLSLAGPLLGVPIDASAGPVELDVADELIFIDRLRVEVRGDLILLSTGEGGHELLTKSLASPAENPPDMMFSYDEQRLFRDSARWPILRESLSDTTPEHYELEQAAAVGYSEILMRFDGKAIDFQLDERL